MLHPLSLTTPLQLSVGVVSFVGVAAAFNVGAFGHVLSTVTAVLGQVTIFPLLALSFTALAFRVNPVVQFASASHVYVNVYVLLHDVQLTVELFDSVNRLVSYVTLPDDILVWLICANGSVHVSVIVHAIHHEIHISAGVHHVHTGFVLSKYMSVFLIVLADRLFHALSVIACVLHI